jgi:hypothetical protein
MVPGVSFDARVVAGILVLAGAGGPHEETHGGDEQEQHRHEQDVPAGTAAFKRSRSSQAFVANNGNVNNETRLSSSSRRCRGGAHVFLEDR